MMDLWTSTSRDHSGEGVPTLRPLLCGFPAGAPGGPLQDWPLPQLFFFLGLCHHSSVRGRGVEWTGLVLGRRLERNDEAGRARERMPGGRLKPGKRAERAPVRRDGPPPSPNSFVCPSRDGGRGRAASPLLCVRGVTSPSLLRTKSRWSEPVTRCCCCKGNEARCVARLPAPPSWLGGRAL